jgi:hypothetical protein
MDIKTEEIWIGEDDVRRKLESAELEAFLADRQTIALEIAQREAEAQAKAQAKAALLERLGITEDEAKLLLA